MKIKNEDYTCVSLFDEYGKIDNEMILVIQKGGGGKSLSSEAMWEEFHESGYLCISLTDVKKECEACYAMFEPQERYHLDKLMVDGKIPRSVPVEIYHPFTFNIPNKLLPNINFFTIPITSLNREKLSFIGETDSSTDSITLVNNALSELNNNSNLYDLVHYIQSKARTLRKRYYGKDIVEADADNFLLETSQKGTIQNVSEIASWFKPFLKNYFLAPKSFKYNLDVMKIFNNQKSYHVLINKWIYDEKLEYFSIMCFFDEILSNIEHCKYPICFLIEEVSALVPFKSEGFKRYLADYFGKRLKIIRNVGRGCTTIMTSQVYSDIDESVREKSTQTFIGNLKGIADIDRIAKSLKYGRDMVDSLRTMDRNKYIMQGNEDYNEFRMLFPSHCHAETKYNFFEMYAKHYKDKMVKYDHMTDEINEHLKEIKKEYKDKAEKVKKEKIEQAKEDYEKASGKLKVEKELMEIKNKVRQDKDMDREEKIRQVSELKQKDPKISVRKIADILGLSKSAISQYLKIVEDRKKLPKVE